MPKLKAMVKSPAEWREVYRDVQVSEVHSKVPVLGLGFWELSLAAVHPA